MLAKRYYSIIAVVVASLALAVVGYLLPEKADGEPQKILLPNAGGRVVFSHEAHMNYMVQDKPIECATCHHESLENRQNVQKCGSCHGVTFDTAFVQTHQQSFNADLASCVTCHHMELPEQGKGTGVGKWDKAMHDEHAEQYADNNCQVCHHTEDIEPEPQSCANCHVAAVKNQPVVADKDMPPLRDAVHTRCMASCHTDYATPGVTGCVNCHDFVNTRETLTSVEQGKAFTQCATCHTDTTPNDLIPERLKAFHMQCMNCHETAQKGPYNRPEYQIKESLKDKHCAQCHGMGA